MTKKITGNAQGHNGPIEYEVDIDQNRVTDLKILKHSETTAVFNDQVVKKLKNSIISQQSFDVDAVTGASEATQSILNSAKTAVANAGVELMPVETEAIIAPTTYYDTDIVVIGGGGAGLTAGCRALDLGKQVILVEKNSYLGGATILNGSNITATGSHLAQEIFGDNGDTPQRLAGDVARESRYTNIPAMTSLMVNNIGPAIDFISRYANLNYQKAKTQTVEHSVDRQVELPTASSIEFIHKVSQAFQDHGGQVLLDTAVNRVAKNNQGEVSFVYATTNGNRRIVIRTKGVILATGGHGANQSMRSKESKGINYYGPMTSTGDAYDFNQELKLKTHDLDWYKIYPHGVQTKPGIAKLTTYGSKLMTDLGGIYVNTAGKRVVNESAPYTDFRDAILKQPDKMCYMIMDERTWKEVYQALVEHDFKDDEIAKYFAEKGKRPYFVKGSLKECADEAGIDYKQLQKTVTDYQQFAKQGHDPEFERDSKYLHLFEGDTFYLVEQTARFATTLGGYSVDPQTLNLIDQDGQDVASYYAVGEVAGGANGHDSMPSMMNTWSISSGYVAGEKASEHVNERLAIGKPQLPNLVAIVGTNAKKSYNRMLLQYMKDTFIMKANIEVLEIRELPLFNEDLADNEPRSVTKLAEKVENADGVIIATPEYDHAVPAALKSIIEWLSYKRHSLNKKKLMIIGASYGIQGTVRAQMSLRQIVDSPGVYAHVMPGNEFMMAHAPQQFDQAGNITNEETIEVLRQCFDAYLKFLKVND